MIFCIWSSNMRLRSTQFCQRRLLNPTASPQINPVRNCSCKLFDSTQNKYYHVVNNCRLSQRWGGCFPLKSTGERLSHDLLQFWQCSACVSPGVQDLHGPLYNSALLLGLSPTPPPPRPPPPPSLQSHTQAQCVRSGCSPREHVCPCRNENTRPHERLTRISIHRRVVELLKLGALSKPNTHTA